MKYSLKTLAIVRHANHSLCKCIFDSKYLLVEIKRETFTRARAPEAEYDAVYVRRENERRDFD